MTMTWIKSVSIPQDEVSLYIEDRPFRHLEEIFPDWPEARQILTNFCDTMRGNWEISFEGDRNILITYIGGALPAEIPDKEYSKLREITQDILDTYTPDLEKYGGTKLCPLEDMQKLILGDIKRREDYIVSRIDRTIKEEYRFRLGIWPRKV